MKTFAQLREELANTKGMNLPSAKRLLEMEDLVVEETGSIKVYQNGFFIYSSNGYRTVFAIDRIKYLKFGDTEFHDIDDMPWQVVVEAIGEYRLEINAAERMNSHVMYGIDEEEAEIRAMGIRSECGTRRQSRIDYEDVETTIINGMWEKHLLAMLPAAMDTLSEKERRVMELYYLDWTQRTEAEVGRVLGISQQAVHKTRVRAIEKLRKFYENQGC